MTRRYLGTYWVDGWWTLCRTEAIAIAKRVGAACVYVSLDGWTPSGQVTWEVERA